MLRCGQDVELLLTVRTVVVADDAKLFQYVKGAVDGRRDGLRIGLATALHELGARDVALGTGQDVDQEASLRRPPQSALA